MIVQFPKISAIYYGLLQSGYDYYTFERSVEHIRAVQFFCKHERASAFFSETKQDTCAVYPYWPRAFIMESATFFLNDGNTDFQDFGGLRRKIMSAGNISEKERSDSLWNWLSAFPSALAAILSDKSFSEYLEWEKKWIDDRIVFHREEICLIEKLLDVCIGQYDSQIREIRMCINPIKCVYSSDYHVADKCFIFTSGAFRTDSVIHEFLHHVVHPVVERKKAVIRKLEPVNDQLDDSYYLSGSRCGLMNAFEETVVRSLTEDVMNGAYPENLSAYIDDILTHKQT